MKNGGRCSCCFAATYNFAEWQNPGAFRAAAFVHTVSKACTRKLPTVLWDKSRADYKLGRDMGLSSRTGCRQVLAHHLKAEYQQRNED